MMKIKKKTEARKIEQVDAQTFIEYTILLTLIGMILVAMSPMVKRGIQAMVKITADQVGNQINSEQIGGKFGHLVNTMSVSRVDQAKTKREVAAEVGYYFDELLDLRHETVYNAGFTRED